MTDDDVRLVRDSHAQLAPMAEAAAAQFYDRVFERAPGIAQLFGGDMAHQGRRLMAMVGDAVALLDDPAALDGALRALGSRHAGYGVQFAHYDVVGGALLDTLAAALGEDFGPAQRRAWAALYERVRTRMQEGAAA